MPERDGYIAGAPCWVDASEPDPEAAVDFYGGLFGWEFEDVMPPGSGSKYSMARGEAEARRSSTRRATCGAATLLSSDRSPGSATGGDLEHLPLGR